MKSNKLNLDGGMLVKLVYRYIITVALDRHLIKTNKQCIAEKEIREMLEYENIKFGVTKLTGDQYFKCAEVKLETRDCDEVIAEFLKTFGNSAEKLNFVSEKYKGFYNVEIVPWMRKNALPSFVFNKEFLDFIGNIKHFQFFEIDMYMY